MTEGQDNANAKPALDADERRRIESSGHFHAVHYIVVAISFIVTFAAWQYSKHQVELRVEAEFDRSADQILELVTERMSRYEDGLWAGVAMMNTNGGTIDLAHWREFAQTLRIDVKYPGINGIGIIEFVQEWDLPRYLIAHRKERPGFHLHPEHDRGVHLPIVYIEPEEINLAAIGLDVAFEDNRYGGVIRARDTGQASITGPIRLVQDEQSTPGFLFYAPYYKGARADTLEERRGNILGVVYAPFVTRKLMDGVLDRDKRLLNIRITDGEEVIFDEHDEKYSNFDPKPMFARQVDVPFYGRTWTFDLRTNTSFRAENYSEQPMVILFCGIAIDTLLLVLFLLLTRSNRRAVEYADRVTLALQHEKQELLASNDALEQFSYAASHDLKTPIRGLRDTADYLAEDMAEQYPDVLRDAAISTHLDDIYILIGRMDRLVKGVLECAQIGRREICHGPLDIERAIQDIALEQSIRRDQIELSGSASVIHFNSTLFYQIVGNILANARTHCEEPEDLRIYIAANLLGDRLDMVIRDNGPGIEPRYHEKVFEMFQCLDRDRNPDLTGIGLAIVRRAAEAIGGAVTLSSSPGEGAAFHITIPGVAAADPIIIAAE